jgi:hypothetical protein
MSGRKFKSMTGQAGLTPGQRELKLQVFFILDMVSRWPKPVRVYRSTDNSLAEAHLHLGFFVSTWSSKYTPHIFCFWLIIPTAIKNKQWMCYNLTSCRAQEIWDARKQCPEDFKLGQFQVKRRTVLFNQRTTIFQQEDMTKLKRGQNYSITGQMRKHEDRLVQKEDKWNQHPDIQELISGQFSVDP